MDNHTFARILHRVETGTTTATDADALRTVFGLPPRPAVRPPLNEEPRRNGPNSERVGSRADVLVTLVRDRYAQGEICIRTTYRLSNGKTSRDASHRVRLDDKIAPIIHNLWDVIFDTAAEALQYEPASVILKLDCTDLDDPWLQILNTIARVVAYELDILLAGAAPNPRDLA